MESTYILLSRRNRPIGVVKGKTGEWKLWEEHGIEKQNDLPVFYDSYLDFNRLLMVAQNGICVFYEK